VAGLPASIPVSIISGRYTGIIETGNVGKKLLPLQPYRKLTTKSFPVRYQKQKSMRKSILTLIGFFLFVFGFLSLVLSMVGVQLVFLTWLDTLGRLLGFLARVIMILAGISIVALAQIDWKKEKMESS
jgi:hypothetical protein